MGSVESPVVCFLFMLLIQRNTSTDVSYLATHKPKYAFRMDTKKKEEES